MNTRNWSYRLDHPAAPCIYSLVDADYMLKCCICGRERKDLAAAGWHLGSELTLSGTFETENTFGPGATVRLCDIDEQLTGSGLDKIEIPIVAMTPCDDGFKRYEISLTLQVPEGG